MVDNKVVVEMDRKVVVMAMVVIAATMAVATADMVLVVAETIKDMVGLKTAFTRNNGLMCLGKNAKPSWMPVIVPEVQTMQM